MADLKSKTIEIAKQVGRKVDTAVIKTGERIIDVGEGLGKVWGNIQDKAVQQKDLIEEQNKEILKTLPTSEQKADPFVASRSATPPGTRTPEQQAYVEKQIKESKQRQEMLPPSYGKYPELRSKVSNATGKPNPTLGDVVAWQVRDLDKRKDAADEMAKGPQKTAVLQQINTDEFWMKQNQLSAQSAENKLMDRFNKGKSVTAGVFRGALSPFRWLATPAIQGSKITLSAALEAARIIAATVVAGVGSLTWITGESMNPNDPEESKAKELFLDLVTTPKGRGNEDSIKEKQKQTMEDVKLLGQFIKESSQETVKALITNFLQIAKFETMNRVWLSWQESKLYDPQGHGKLPLGVVGKSVEKYDKHFKAYNDEVQDANVVTLDRPADFINGKLELFWQNPGAKEWKVEDQPISDSQANTIATLALIQPIGRVYQGLFKLSATGLKSVGIRTSGPPQMKVPVERSTANLATDVRIALGDDIIKQQAELRVLQLKQTTGGASEEIGNKIITLKSSINTATTTLNLSDDALLASKNITNSLDDMLITNSGKGAGRFQAATPAMSFGEKVQVWGHNTKAFFAGKYNSARVNPALVKRDTDALRMEYGTNAYGDKFEKALSEMSAKTLRIHEHASSPILTDALGSAPVNVTDTPGIVAWIKSQARYTNVADDVIYEAAYNTQLHRLFQNKWKAPLERLLKSSKLRKVTGEIKETPKGFFIPSSTGGGLPPQVGSAEYAKSQAWLPKDLFSTTPPPKVVAFTSDEILLSFSGLVKSTYRKAAQIMFHPNAMKKSAEVIKAAQKAGDKNLAEAVYHSVYHSSLQATPSLAQVVSNWIPTTQIGIASKKIYETLKAGVAINVRGQLTTRLSYWFFNKFFDENTRLALATGNWKALFSQKDIVARASGGSVVWNGQTIRFNLSAGGRTAQETLLEQTSATLVKGGVEKLATRKLPGILGTMEKVIKSKVSEIQHGTINIIAERVYPGIYQALIDKGVPSFLAHNKALLESFHYSCKVVGVSINSLAIQVAELKEPFVGFKLTQFVSTTALAAKQPTLFALLLAYADSRYKEIEKDPYVRSGAWSFRFGNRQYWPRIPFPNVTDLIFLPERELRKNLIKQMTAESQQDSAKGKSTYEKYLGDVGIVGFPGTPNVIISGLCSLADSNFKSEEVIPFMKLFNSFATSVLGRPFNVWESTVESPIAYGKGKIGEKVFGKETPVYKAGAGKPEWEEGQLLKARQRQLEWKFLNPEKEEEAPTVEYFYNEEAAYTAWDFIHNFIGVRMSNQPTGQRILQGAREKHYGDQEIIKKLDPSTPEAKAFIAWGIKYYNLQKEEATIVYASVRYDRRTKVNLQKEQSRAVEILMRSSVPNIYNIRLDVACGIFDDFERNRNESMKPKAIRTEEQNNMTKFYFYLKNLGYEQWQFEDAAIQKESRKPTSEIYKSASPEYQKTMTERNKNLPEQIQKEEARKKVAEYFKRHEEIGGIK